jgi:hypothetical protein
MRKHTARMKRCIGTSEFQKQPATKLHLAESNIPSPPRASLIVANCQASPRKRTTKTVERPEMAGRHKAEGALKRRVVHPPGGK